LNVDFTGFLNVLYTLGAHVNCQEREAWGRGWRREPRRKAVGHRKEGAGSTLEWR